MRWIRKVAVSFFWVSVGLAGACSNPGDPDPRPDATAVDASSDAGARPGDAGADDAGEEDSGTDAGPEACGPLPESSSVVYVDGDATAGGDGRTWATAFNDLVVALQSAVDDQQVWVAQGVYRPVVPEDRANVTSVERNVSFVVPSGVAVLGGFGAQEARECERDPGALLTILSGDLNGDDSDTDDDGISDTNLDDNTYSVVRIIDGQPGTWLDGFTITGGNTGTNGSAYGGGLVTDGGAPLLSNLHIVDNHSTWLSGSGGGAASLNGDPTFRNVVFEANNSRLGASGASGGGLYITGDGHARLEGCRFVGNQARTQGGALFVSQGGATATVRETTFEDNDVRIGPGGNGAGGAVSVDGGGAIFSRVMFLRNTAQVAGGAMSVRTGDVIVSHAVFADNEAEESWGGALFASSGSIARVTVQYTVMTRNKGRNGGAIGARRDVSVSHSTIANNESVGAGGAAYVLNFEAKVMIHNSIVWGNTATGGGVAFNGNGIEATRSIVHDTGGSPWDANPVDRGYDGGAIIDIDPAFVDPSNPEGPDGLWGTEDDGLRLAQRSPAVGYASDADLADIDLDGDRREVLPDVGDYDGDGDAEGPLMVDISGNPRVAGAGPDIGAYETVGVPAASPRTVFVDARASGTNDGTSWADAFVDLQSALALAAQGDEVWVAAGTYVPGDTRDDSFTLPAGVSIYGGFAGTETTREQRNPDPASNETVLSGEIGAAGSSDNAKHVVTSGGAGPDSILDGSRSPKVRSTPAGVGASVVESTATPAPRRFATYGSWRTKQGLVPAPTSTETRNLNFAGRDSPPTRAGKAAV